MLYSTFLANIYEESFRASLNAAGATVSDKVLWGCVGGELISSLLAVSCITVAFCSNMIMVSDKVTGEVGLTPLVKYRSIEEPAVEWAKVILEDMNLTDDRIKDSKQAQEMIRSKGFDVRQQASLMTDFYIKGTNPPGFVTK